MAYFEQGKDYYAVWPYLAISIHGEFWIEIGWLDFAVGWRNADDGGHGNKDPLGQT